MLLSNLQNSNITFQNIASPLSLDKAKKEFPDVYGLGSENVIFLGSIINDYIKSFFSKTLHVDFSIKDENLFQKSVESDIVKFLNGKMFGNTKKDTKIESIFEMNDTLKMRILTARVVSLTLRNVLIKKFLLENVHFEDLPKDTVQKNPKLIAAVKKIMEVYPATCNDVVIDAFLAGNKSYDLFSDYISQVIENNMSDLSQSEKNIFVALFLNGSLFKNASSYTKTIDLEALYFFRKGIGFLENQAKQFDKLIKQYFESKPQDV